MIENINIIMWIERSFFSFWCVLPEVGRGGGGRLGGGGRVLGWRNQGML